MVSMRPPCPGCTDTSGSETCLESSSAAVDDTSLSAPWLLCLSVPYSRCLRIPEISPQSPLFSVSEGDSTQISCFKIHVQIGAREIA